MKRLIYTLMLLVAGTLFAAGNADRNETPEELNISYVKSPFNLQIMVMKDLELLEKEFSPDGIQIIWHEITSGAKQAEAMAAGSLDIASVMNTASVIITNAAGNPVDIIAMVSRPEQTFAVMVREDGPRTVKELEGATAAGPKGTVLHQMLEGIKTKEGLESLKLISMGLPQSQSALLSGDVDAALLAGALIIKTREAGGRVLTTSEGYAVPRLVSASPRSFREKHPEIVDRYRRVQEEAYDYIMNQQKQALAIGAAEQGLSAEDALDLYMRSGMAKSFTRSDLDGLKEDVDFLLELEMIENDIDPAEFIPEELYAD